MGSWVLFLLGGAAVIIVVYNRIAALSHRRRNAFADIDVQLEQRYNTIPNMVEVVKAYAGHEHKVFKEIAEARAATKDAFGVGEKRFKAEAVLGQALNHLYAVAENYPELKANENFMMLQQELSDLENKISAARRFFNSATAEYNTAIEQFPGNIMARMFGYFEEPYFRTDGDKEEEIKAIPEVKMAPVEKK
ncbi:MAG TPA: LemA family protein [Alphaproteobacteria bacterium]|nr:LemA family protein [Alphaproteobacteria bacterium]HNS43612.1 LemA family protein [Alphaproteobacteria bacterium]